MTRVIRIGFLVLCSVAVFWQLRLAAADFCDRRGDASSVATATHLAPSRADYLSHLAILQPGQAPGLLHEALRLNPYDAASLLELASRAESGGRAAEAEQLLLRAARVDRTYLPRWALTNFYLRQKQDAEFWRWAHAAAELPGPDLAALFQLEWDASHDAELIVSRGASGRIGSLRTLLRFLLSKDELPAAHQVAKALLGAGSSDDAPDLSELTDRLADAGAVGGAVEIWNAMVTRKWIMGTALAPAEGRSWTNGDFALPISSHGFGWRVAELPGVFWERETQANYGLELAFDGNEPERCALISQAAPVIGGQSYRLGYRYSTQGLAERAGLHWSIAWRRNGQDIAAASADLGSGDSQTGQWDLSAPPDADSVRLVLTYQRALGASRIEGRLRLRAVEMELLPRQAISQNYLQNSFRRKQ